MLVSPWTGFTAFHGSVVRGVGVGVGVGGGLSEQATHNKQQVERNAYFINNILAAFYFTFKSKYVPIICKLFLALPPQT
jgi:hypothetical protein